MNEKYNKSELQKAIESKYAELNAVVDAAIEKGEKINKAEIMRISKELDLLINQYTKSATDTDNSCI